MPSAALPIAMVLRLITLRSMMVLAAAVSAGS